MRKKKHAQPENWIDVNTVDCGELAPFVQVAINEKRSPTMRDLATVSEYTHIQLCACMTRLNNMKDTQRIVHDWSDCLGYALLASSVSEVQAEYHCPRSRWLCQEKEVES